MKKATFLTFIILALLVSACSKTKSPSYGTYTINSQTYDVGFADWVLGYFVGNTVKNAPTGTIALEWGGITGYYVPTLPTNGTYAVSTVDPPAPGFVYIRVTDTSATRSYVSRERPTGQVTVTIDTGGRNLSVNISNVQMFSDKNPSDSAILNGSFHQSR
jgi:hypothetical protein